MALRSVWRVVTAPQGLAMWCPSALAVPRSVQYAGCEYATRGAAGLPPTLPACARTNILGRAAMICRAMSFVSPTALWYDVCRARGC